MNISVVHVHCMFVTIHIVLKLSQIVDTSYSMLAVFLHYAHTSRIVKLAKHCKITWYASQRLESRDYAQ